MRRLQMVQSLSCLELATGRGDKLIGWLRPPVDARFLEMGLAMPAVDPDTIETDRALFLLAAVLARSTPDFGASWRRMLCSTADDTHDAIIEFYHERLSARIEAAETDEIPDAWDI